MDSDLSERCAKLSPLRALLLLSAVVGSLTQAGCLERRVSIRGSGATFPAPLYARWIALYHREQSNVHVRYDAVGSSAGVRAITERKVHLGATDTLLTELEEQALPAPILTIPTAIGPVVMAYNLPGLEEELTLDGDTLAGIYLGEITRWNDPLLAAINPGVPLPDSAIHVAHRSDGSGTTNIFTDYLSRVNETWKERVGCGNRVKWPTGDEWAGEGNDGVAHRILLLPGGIGYVELKYAQNAGLSYATLINASGQRVRPSVETVQEAERNTEASDGLLKPSIVNAPGASSYPICGFTYLLVYKDLTYMQNPAQEQAIVDFLRWTLTTGQAKAAELHYTPLPSQLREEALKTTSSIRVTPLESADAPSSHAAGPHTRLLATAIQTCR